MEIPQKDLEDFKRIYKKDYGEDLSDEEAQVIAGRVVDLLRIICQPISNSNKR